MLEALFDYGEDVRGFGEIAQFHVGFSKLIQELWQTIIHEAVKCGGNKQMGDSEVVLK